MSSERKGVSRRQFLGNAGWAVAASRWWSVWAGLLGLPKEDIDQFHVWTVELISVSIDMDVASRHPNMGRCVSACERAPSVAVR